MIPILTLALITAFGIPTISIGSAVVVLIIGTFIEILDMDSGHSDICSQRQLGVFDWVFEERLQSEFFAVFAGSIVSNMNQHVNGHVFVSGQVFVAAVKYFAFGRISYLYGCYLRAVINVLLIKVNILLLKLYCTYYKYFYTKTNDNHAALNVHFHKFLDLLKS